MRVSKKLLIGALAASALVLTGCAPSADQPDASPETPNSEEGTSAEQKSVDVAILTSTSGPLASYGAQYVDGLEAGIDYVTGGTGEIDGITINLIYGDDKGDPDTAINLAKDYIGQGIGIIAGTAVSGISTQLAEQAAQNKILYISGPAAADAITGVNEYTFRSGRQSMQDVATAGTFLDDINGKNVVVYAQDNAFGGGNVMAVEMILGDKGANVTSVLVPEDATEFTAFSQQLIDADPDLVFVAWAGATSGSMWQSLSQQGVFDNVPVVTGLGDSPTFSAFGEASEQISFLNHYFAGAPDNPVNDAMLSYLEDKGKTADLFTPDGFNAAVMIAEAVSKGQGDVEAARAALEGFTFDGPKGKNTIRAEDHALIQDMYQVKLVADGDSFVPELISSVDAELVAPPVMN
ncbi:MAG TPA: substrate-binding domain-containing protein [Microbacteriaceae bacterium]|nr:substrate-binding domain-containing protein [Microbacteriaceae bacterium]